MKLLYRIISRVSIALVVVLTAWAALFYLAIMDEINDEVDDSLDDYSEVIIMRSLGGEELPSKNIGSNNQYFLTEVSKEYVQKRKKIIYLDSMIYIHEKKETEPARIIKTIFNDGNNHFYELTVSTPTIEKNDLIESILGWIIFLYVLLLIVILLINFLVFSKSMQPLFILLKWLDLYKIGQKNSELDNPTIVTEFRKLNEVAIRHTQRSERMFEQQKQFIGNASHEMQTPLAICLNRIEMLMEDDSLSVKQMEEIEKMHKTLDYITRLNKALLLLSKIENDQFPDCKEININLLIQKYLPDYKEVFAYKKVQIEIKEEGTFYVFMNESLAITLITNLLKNAFVHNIPQGIIVIHLSNQTVSFGNSGILSALDSKHIFERFYQGNKKEGSTGLGLAIVDSICKLQHLQLSYCFKNNLHYFSFFK